MATAVVVFKDREILSKKESPFAGRLCWLQGCRKIPSIRGGGAGGHENILSRAFGQTLLALYFSIGGNLGGNRGNLSWGGVLIPS